MCSVGVVANLSWRYMHLAPGTRALMVAGFAAGSCGEAVCSRRHAWHAHWRLRLCFVSHSMVMSMFSTFLQEMQ